MGAARKVDSVRIYREMRDNPGRVYHYRDLASLLGYDDAAQNVSTLLARAARLHPEYGFRKVGDDRSGQYVYRAEFVIAPGDEVAQPEEAPNEKLYEVVGFMPDHSTMVVRDDAGEMSLWRKVEIN